MQIKVVPITKERLTLKKNKIKKENKKENHQA